MTNEQLVKSWFAGEEVKVISMGGLGDAYEAAIWEMAMSLLDRLNQNPLDFDQIEKMTDDERHELRASLDTQLSEVYERVGPSGAQVGAAWNAALVLHRQGYDAAMKMAPEDRHISIARVPVWE